MSNALSSFDKSGIFCLISLQQWKCYRFLQLPESGHDGNAAARRGRLFAETRLNEEMFWVLSGTKSRSAVQPELIQLTEIETN